MQSRPGRSPRPNRNSGPGRLQAADMPDYSDARDYAARRFDRTGVCDVFRVFSSVPSFAPRVGGL